jgi:hypothetical protein
VLLKPENVLSGASSHSFFLGKAEELLESLPADSVDLVFTSPPYSGKGRRYGGEATNLRGVEWARWMADVVKSCLRVCRGLVAVVADAGVCDHRYDAAVIHLQSFLDLEGVHLFHPGCYYRSGIPGMSTFFRSDWEFIAYFHRPGPLHYSVPTAIGAPPKYRPGGAMSHRVDSGARVPRRKYRPPAVANPGNVRPDFYTSEEVAAILASRRSFTAVELASLSSASGDPRGDVRHVTVGGGHMGNSRAHASAAPFSLETAVDHVVVFCPPGGVVLDPFVGSGTTVEAALRHGRRCVAGDTDPAMIQLCQERMKACQP